MLALPFSNLLHVVLLDSNSAMLAVATALKPSHSPAELLGAWPHHASQVTQTQRGILKAIFGNLANYANSTHTIKDNGPAVIVTSHLDLLSMLQYCS